MKPQNIFFKILIFGLAIILSSCSKDEETFTPSASNITESIDENPSSGTTIGTIATNLTGTLNYSILSESVPNAFSVSNSGIVTVNDRFVYDFETNPTLAATISVTNSSDSATSMVNVTLNNVDDIASFLTASKTAYNSASTGEWIEITSDEYTALQTTLNNVSKVGTTESQYTFSSASTSSSGPWTLSNVSDATIPSGSFVFAFKYYAPTKSNISGNKVKQSITSHTSGYNDLGGVLPNHNGTDGNICFVLKGNNNNTTSLGYLAVFMSSSNRMGYHSSNQNGYVYQPSDSSDLSGSSGRYTFLYQGLSTTQKQWD